MNILNRNQTIKEIKSKKWWYNRFKNESKFGWYPRPETFYFGIFSRRQIKLNKI